MTRPEIPDAAVAAIAAAIEDNPVAPARRQAELVVRELLRLGFRVDSPIGRPTKAAATGEFVNGGINPRRKPISPPPPPESAYAPVTARIEAHMADTQTPGSTAPELTARQRQMLHWLSDGLTVAEIAARFRMRQGEVLQEVEGLRVVFGARTDAQLVGIAHEAGLLVPARLPWASEKDRRGRDVEVARFEGLTSKPRATAADARLIAARLEAGFAGGEPR